MQNKEVRLILAYGAVFAFQIAWHWFLSRNVPFARDFLNIYLYHDGGPWRHPEGYLDVLLPAVLLGFSTGWIGRRWRLPKQAVYVFFAGIGIVALLPLYVIFLDKNLLWFRPVTVSDFIYRGFTALVATAVMAHAGSVFWDHFYGSKS